MKYFKPFSYSLLIFLVLFLLLFIKFPLNNCIGGTCDTQLFIASSNYFSDYIHHIFTGSQLTTSMYPITNLLQWGESAVGLLSLFNLFKLLGFNDVLSWYFFVVTIFALNGVGVFRITYFYTKNFFTSLLGGLLFSFTNFAFVNIDDVHVLFYFFTLLSVFYLLRFKETDNKKFLLLSAVLASIQIYFSFYVFVYGALVYLIFFIYTNNCFRKINLKKAFYLSLSLFLYLAIALPFIIYYWKTKNSNLFYTHENASWNNTISMAYLKLSDLFNVMPNNMLYESLYYESDFIFTFFEIRKLAFIGTLFLSLGIFYMIKHFKKCLPWVLVFFSGLLFSTYPYVILSSHIPVLEAVRIPYRAYMISILALSIITTIGLTESFKKYGTQKQLVLLSLIFLIHIVENIPFPFPLSDIGKIKAEVHREHNIVIRDGFKSENMIPDENLIESIQTNTDEESVLLFLPSNRIFDGELSMFTFNRELIYMNYQTYFKRNIFNGVHGYFPKSKIEIQKYIEKLPDEEAYGFLSKAGMTHIVYCKEFVLDSYDNILKDLIDSKELRIIEETNLFVIFEFNL